MRAAAAGDRRADGRPQEDRKKLFDWSNQMVGDQDPEFAANDAIGASVELIMYGMQMAADRVANPGDDLVTKLVQADVEGHKLSDDEFGFFVILLAVAGNETTRNSITQGMMAFTDFPTSGSCSSGSGLRPPPTRSSAGPRRSPRSSAPRCVTPNCPG